MTRITSTDSASETRWKMAERIHTATAAASSACCEWIKPKKSLDMSRRVCEALALSSTRTDIGMRSWMTWKNANGCCQDTTDESMSCSRFKSRGNCQFVVLYYMRKSISLPLTEITLHFHEYIQIIEGSCDRCCATSWSLTTIEFHSCQKLSKKTTSFPSFSIHAIVRTLSISSMLYVVCRIQIQIP